MKSRELAGMKRRKSSLGEGDEGADCNDDGVEEEEERRKEEERVWGTLGN